MSGSVELKLQSFDHISICKLSQISQIWFILYEVHQTGHRHKTFVNVAVPLPTLKVIALHLFYFSF